MEQGRYICSNEILNLNRDRRPGVWHGYGIIYDELMKKIGAAVVDF